MSITLARTAAHAAYTAAVANPAGTDWRELAETLFSALPALPKAVRESGRPAWWAEYELPRSYLTDSLDVLFACGETVRVNIMRAPRGLPRVPAACRAAVGFYRSRHGWDHAVPAFASLTTVDTGATFDAAACSTFTAELRAIPGTVTRRAVTLDSIARMESELARREAGLADAVAAWDALPARVRENEESADAKMLGAWQAAVTGGREELQDMRDDYRRQRGEAVPYRNRAPAAPVPSDAWLVDVADCYGEPAEVELAGTFEADAGLIPVDVRPISPAVDTSEINVLHVPLAYSRPIKAELVQSAPVAEPAPAAAEPEAWEPSLADYPVVALALSHAAREALFERVMDGTFPDAERAAKCGAWRLTLADALALQDVPSLRFVGMPRKPRTAAAAPVPAPMPAPMPAPVAPVPFTPAGPAFYPVGHRGDHAVIVHSPNL